MPAPRWTPAPRPVEIQCVNPPTPSQRRRLLVVSYWFPPAVGAAAERMASFVKYLPLHGWDVDVLTARHGDVSEVRTADEAGGSPDGLITAVPDPWQRRRAVIQPYDPRAKGPPRWRRWLRDLVFPDRFKRWANDALWMGIDEIGHDHPNMILASFPPASAAQLGLRLHEKTGVPLVLDLRDKWLGPGGYEPMTARARRRHEDLERRAVAAATGIIGVSDTLVRDVAVRCGFDLAKTAVVHNGFEPIETPGPSPRRADSPGKFVIAHVGTVIPRNRPDLFFDSLQSAAGLGDVEFRFVGNLSNDYVRSLGLGGLLTATGLVPRDAARAAMFEADALLLLTGDYVARWGYSVKLFEYLQTGRPILCLEESPDSNDARLLRDLAPDRAFIGRLGDPASLVEQEKNLRRWMQQHLEAPASATFALDQAEAHNRLCPFNRAKQAGELAAFLSGLSVR